MKLNLSSLFNHCSRSIYAHLAPSVRRFCLLDVDLLTKPATSARGVVCAFLQDVTQLAVESLLVNVTIGWLAASASRIAWPTFSRAGSSPRDSHMPDCRSFLTNQPLGNVALCWSIILVITNDFSNLDTAFMYLSRFMHMVTSKRRFPMWLSHILPRPQMTS